MPVWVRGNQVYTQSTNDWRLGLSSSFIRHSIFLGDADGSQTQLMMQPGVLRGLNVFISRNDGFGNDLDIKFAREVYDGGTGWAAETEFTLFTIPSGEVGHFCAPKITTELADRSWARWDRCSIMQRREAGLGGIVDHWTIAVLVEITEETLLDTTFPPNRAIQN